jgi:hypothetical protein
MALLEYATLTVPDVVKKSVDSFFSNDPLLNKVMKGGKVMRSGGTQVRIKRLKGGHSDVVEINQTNLSVPLVRYPSYGQMTGDWAKYIKPIILPHLTRDRLPTPGEKAQWVKEETQAAMMSLQNEVCRQVYIGRGGAISGAVSGSLTGLGTLNGYRTTGTSSGFENGGIIFDTPAAQAGTQYLNEARVVDTTNDLDNWYNQFLDHGGIGTGFLPALEECKMKADSYAQEGGIDIALMSIADHVDVAEEVRSYPGGAADGAIVYTPADLASGKAHQSVHIVNGVQIYGNRWMTDAGIDDTGTDTEHVYALNSKYVEWWVNAGNDFKVTKFFDGLETSNQDADIGYIILECQFALPALLVHAGLSS